MLRNASSEMHRPKSGTCVSHIRRPANRKEDMTLSWQNIKRPKRCPWFSFEIDICACLAPTRNAAGISVDSKQRNRKHSARAVVVNHSPLQILRTQRSNLEEQHAQVPLPSEGPPIPLSKKLTNIGTEHCTQQFPVRAPEQLLHQKSLLKRASQPHFHLRARSPSEKILMKTATTTTKILVMVFL